MAKKLPWFSWYADKWLSDESLRSVSIAARGLWADMLSLMHKCDRRGYLQLVGKPVTAEQLARMTGCSTDEVSRLLAELLHSGVASVTDDGIVYSRLMVRDETKRRKCSDAGKRGGNPTLKGSSKGRVKGRVKGGLNHASIVCIESSSLKNETHQEGVGGVGEGGTFKGQVKGRAVDCLDGDFDRFWKAYPNHNAKRDAAQAWDELAPDGTLVSQILGAIERQKKTDKWQRNIIPNAGNWLRGARWEDAGVVCEIPGESPRQLAERLCREREEYEKERARLEAERGGRRLCPEILSLAERISVPVTNNKTNGVAHG